VIAHAPCWYWSGHAVRIAVERDRSSRAAIPVGDPASIGRIAAYTISRAATPRRRKSAALFGAQRALDRPADRAMQSSRPHDLRAWIAVWTFSGFLARDLGGTPALGHAGFDADLERRLEETRLKSDDRHERQVARVVSRNIASRRRARRRAGAVDLGGLGRQLLRDAREVVLAPCSSAFGARRRSRERVRQRDLAM